MGWTYQNDKPSNVKQYMDSKVKGVVASAIKGNEYYAAVQSIANPNEVYGLVALLDRKGGFGYKWIEETMGPYATNCPASVLDKLTPTEDTCAIRWREQCAALNLTKQLNNKFLRDGAVIKLDTPLSFGAYGTEDTFTVDKVGRTVRFYMKKNGIKCRITKWQTRPFIVIDSGMTHA